ncbi:MAG TPA: putative glycoside hydrolase [Longimicrobiales bacterium]|nr:putative glycoside hydrolase [Longimicrobiales bacterium]
MEQRGDRVTGAEALARRRLKLAAGVFAIAALGVAGVATRYGGDPPVDPPADPAAVLDAAGAIEPLAEAAGLADGDGATTAESGGGPDGGPEPASDDRPPDPAPVRRDWASPREQSPISAEPASQRVAKPRAVRGLYIGSWPAGSARRLPELIRLADETEVNAFVIDIKDVTGEVSYATEVPLAKQLGADRRLKIRDVREMLAQLRDHGIYPIARIVAFKDPLLADARPEWAVQRADGSVWQDDKGVRWVDAFNEDVWAYNIELAREAIALGFSEVQWDYVRFPDAPQSYMTEAVYRARRGRTMSQGIRAFMIRSREELDPLGVPITADVFGITTSAFRDVGIGQLWEDMADVMDVLLPMVYPSHYPRGTWGFPRPNAAPYQVVLKALNHGVSRSRDIEGAATIRPWLQAFDLGPPDYTPEYIRAQIDAVYDAGLTEWILWNPAGRYDARPLATARGREPWFAGRGASLYEPPEPGPTAEDTAPIGVAADSAGVR